MFFVNRLQRTAGFLSFFEFDCKEPVPTIAKNPHPRGPRDAQAAQEQPGAARRCQHQIKTKKSLELSWAPCGFPGLSEAFLGSLGLSWGFLGLSWGSPTAQPENLRSGPAKNDVEFY